MTRPFVEIARFSSNVDKNVAFYRALLNATPAHYEPGEIAVFLIDGVKLLIHANYRDSAEDPGAEDHIAICAEDIDNVCAELQAAGIEVELPPRDYPWGRSAYVRDPDGRLVEITRDG